MVNCKVSNALRRFIFYCASIVSIDNNNKKPGQYCSPLSLISRHKKFVCRLLKSPEPKSEKISNMKYQYRNLKIITITILHHVVFWYLPTCKYRYNTLTFYFRKIWVISTLDFTSQWAPPPSSTSHKKFQNNLIIFIITTMLSRSLLQQVTRSTVRSSSAVAAFSTTRSACLDFVPPQTAKVTPPTDSVPDVQTFLTKIGRGAVGAADNFESWQDFMTMSSFQMKQKGIETRVRR